MIPASRGREPPVNDERAQLFSRHRGLTPPARLIPSNSPDYNDDTSAFHTGSIIMATMNELIESYLEGPKLLRPRLRA